jgi:hypothetical protein
VCFIARGIHIPIVYTSTSVLTEYDTERRSVRSTTHSHMVSTTPKGPHILGTNTAESTKLFYVFKTSMAIRYVKRYIIWTCFSDSYADDCSNTTLYSIFTKYNDTIWFLLNFTGTSYNILTIFKFPWYNWFVTVSHYLLYLYQFYSPISTWDV